MAAVSDRGIIIRGLAFLGLLGFILSFMVVALLGIVLSSYRDALKDNLTGVGTNDRLVHLAVIIAGLSIAAFSVSALLAGSMILVTGLGVAATGTRGLLKRKFVSSKLKVLDSMSFPVGYP
jgi:hypothetical protein